MPLVPFQTYLLATIIGVVVSSAATTTTAVRRPQLDRHLEENSDESLLLRNESCKLHEIDFILVQGDADLVSVEDDIRVQLSRFGFDVQTRFLSKEDFNAAHQSGDFHLSFSETWGAPYDPHAYASGWVAGDEGHLPVLSNIDPSRSELFDRIDTVLKEENHKAREEQWKDIHNIVHQNAVMLPLWGKRIPTILNNRLVGYEAGNQQFDYPVHRLQVLQGPKRVTIAPGAQTGLFQSVGRLDPHTYRPNEFFASHWVYEGLVGYGPQGQILPALASSWEEQDKVYTFHLRPNVSFHDQTPWNCAAAALNFDHVLAEPLRTPDWHGWYGLIEQVESWECTDDMTFVVTLKIPYYPFLQELSFIRPLRMLSPAAFANGNDSDPQTANSCHEGWGTITHEEQTVTCAGIRNISGTGPFVFASRDSIEQDDGTIVDNQVVFQRNRNYWGGEPSIEELVIQRYESSEDVIAALRDETLDVVWGSGVLQAQDLVALDDEEGHLSFLHTHDVQNVILLINSGKPPLDDISVRKTIIHAIDKSYIVENELGGVQRPVDNVFPLDAPYCDVDLTPRWDRDFEKAIFLNCPEDTLSSTEKRQLAVGLGVGLGCLCMLLLVVAVFYFSRTKQLENELQFKTSSATEA